MRRCHSPLVVVLLLLSQNPILTPTFFPLSFGNYRPVTDIQIFIIIVIIMSFASLPFVYTVVLAAATFFGIVVYAFSLLFATVIMPGLNALEDDTEYLRAFQVIDGTIQNNEPWFIISWVSSMILAMALAALTIRRCDATPRRRLAMVVVCVVFLAGHVITVTQNIPRNNVLHAMDLDNNDAATLAAMRQDFAGPWSAYNVARTVLFGTASIYWLVELTLVNSNVAFANKSDASSSFESPPEVEAHFYPVV